MTTAGDMEEGSDPNSPGRLQTIFSVTQSPVSVAGAIREGILNRLQFVL